MSNNTTNYKLSLYKELTILNESHKSKVALVKDIRDNKIYIKKILSNYKIEVYRELQRLNEINIPKILEIIEDEGTLVIIEEFINGQTLQEILEGGILEEDKVIDYMIKLCDILDRIHNLSNPIIHRDIKPSNIIIDNNGILKLIDFDVSRVFKESGNRDTQILGTEGYASPEQFGFDQTNPRSDIYSLGVLMNELTTGALPRERRNSGRLSKIISKCIEISPNERYKSAKELKVALINAKENKKVYVKSKNPIRNIPGYRKGSPLYIITASLWYLFLCFGATMNMRTKDYSLIREDVSVAIILLLLTLLYGNFNDIQSKLPLLKNNNTGKRVGGLILYTLILITVYGLMLEKL